MCKDILRNTGQQPKCNERVLCSMHFGICHGGRHDVKRHIERTAHIAKAQSCLGSINSRVAQSEFRKILKFRVVAEKVHSARAKHRESSQVGGGGVVAEPSKKKSVDSSINHFFVRRLKQVINIRRKRIFP